MRFLQDVSVAVAMVAGGSAVAQAVTATPSYEVPQTELKWELLKPLKFDDASVVEIRFSGRPEGSECSGKAGPAGDAEPGPDLKDEFDEDCAMGWVLHVPNAEDAIGMAQVSGSVVADIEQGIGNAAVGARATGSVSYAGVQAEATDQQSIAIASDAAPIGVGGSVQIMGSGAGFSITVTPDRPTAQRQRLADVDSKGWRPANSATVLLEAVTVGNINLQVGPDGMACKGEVAGEAMAGAYVAFRR